MKKIRIFFGLFMAVMSLQLHAQQNVSISDVNGATPDASSVLDVSSTSKGLLIPRLTTIQRNAISNPANGLIVYDTDVKCFMYWTSFNSSWNYLCNTGSNGSNMLANTTPESPGANCPAGGVKIEFGLDANNDLLLGPGEINATLTKYVCNGATGAQGIQGVAGTNGAQGIQGVAGPAGAAGATGSQGPAGPVGCPTANYIIKSDGTSATCTVAPIFEDASGKVGIGTTSPSNKLSILTSTINDGIYSTDGTRWMLNLPGTTGNGSYNNIVSANDNAVIFSGGTQGSGNLVIAPWASATTGIKILGSNGNVGIGTTSPSQKLDIVGNVQFSQALMPNSNAGTTGQVLISQGANTAPIWSSPYGGNIQYVKGTTDITINSATFADMTDMTLTFTPKHNVVFLNFSAAGDMVASGAAMAYCSFKIVKDGTDVANAGTGSLTTDYDDFYGGATAWNSHFTMFPINVTAGVQTTIKIQWNRGGLYPTTLRNRVSTNPTYSHRSLMIFD